MPVLVLTKEVRAEYKKMCDVPRPWQMLQEHPGLCGENRTGGQQHSHRRRKSLPLMQPNQLWIAPSQSISVIIQVLWHCAAAYDGALLKASALQGARCVTSHGMLLDCQREVPLRPESCLGAGWVVERWLHTQKRTVRI